MTVFPNKNIVLTGKVAIRITTPVLFAVGRTEQLKIFILCFLVKNPNFNVETNRIIM